MQLALNYFYKLPFSPPLTTPTCLPLRTWRRPIGQMQGSNAPSVSLAWIWCCAIRGTATLSVSVSFPSARPNRPGRKSISSIIGWGISAETKGFALCDLWLRPLSREPVFHPTKMDLIIAHLYSPSRTTITIPYECFPTYLRSSAPHLRRPSVFNNGRTEW